MSVETKPEPRPEPDVEPNYRYWREHGGEWADNYDARKKRQVLYHIQELMLTEYVLRHASPDVARPTRVLEFGCGVGRHLRNLSRLPGVDVHGFDQSAAMAGCIPRWSGRAWFESHVTVGMPTGPLPFDDGEFDLVYTAEVLVHVRPEHLDGILAELLRICRGHVLHMETSEQVVLYSGAHEGCWRHDLPSAYARIGMVCEVLPSGYAAHTPFRVVAGEPPRFTWAPAIIEMYRRLERDMNEGFAAVEETARGANVATAIEQERRAAELERRAAQLQAATEELTRSLAASQSRIAELEAALAAAAERAARAEQMLAGERLSAESMRTRADELERQVDSVRRTLADEAASWRARATELETALAQEKARASTLQLQRERFITAVSGYVRR